MKHPRVFETIATRLLDRHGIRVIWLLHLRASASHLDGNWLAAIALIGIADAAERQWAPDFFAGYVIVPPASAPRRLNFATAFEKVVSCLSREDVAVGSDAVHFLL